MTAVILAAGYGSRLRPLTSQMHKTMVPVAGERIIDRIMVSLQLAKVASAWWCWLSQRRGARVPAIALRLLHAVDLRGESGLSRPTTSTRWNWHWNRSTKIFY